jgi:uncharacterized membrane protein
LRRLSDSLPRPHTVYLVLALSFGLAVLAANPPFQAPDEGDHFYRACQLSEGVIFGQVRDKIAGGELPIPLIVVANTEGIAFHPEKKMTWEIFRRKLQPSFLRWNDAVGRSFVGFPHMVVYPPVSYLPQTIGIFFGKILRIGPLGLMYLARLGVFVASISLGYAALRCLPIYRWTALVVLLCPMSLYLMGSVAPDALLVAAAFLLLALLLTLRIDVTHAVTLRKHAAILALGSLLVTAKFVYFPVAAMALMFVLPRFSSRSGKAAYSLAWAAICLLPAVLWIHFAASLYTPGRTDIPLDPVAQAHYMAGAPLTFLRLVANTVRAQYSGTYHWLVGVLGWGDTPLPNWFYNVYGGCVVGCLLMEASGAGGVALVGAVDNAWRGGERRRLDLRCPLRELEFARIAQPD